MSKVLNRSCGAIRMPWPHPPMAHPFGIEMKMKPFQLLELASTRSFGRFGRWMGMEYQQP